MALKQRETTRWIARVGTWIKAAIRFVAEVLESLLNLKEKENLQTKGLKTVDLSVRWGTYLLVNNWITGAHLAIGASMRFAEFSLTEMFLALWAFDFIVAGTFVAIYEVTGKDLSVGKDFRRVADTINKESQIAGLAVMLINIFLAIVWNGPERTITFFRKEIGTIKRLVVVLVVLTATQAFLWATLYYYAFSWVIKHL